MATTISAEQLEHFGRQDGIGAALGKRFDLGRQIHIHPHDAIELRLVGLFNEQAALHGREEILIDRLGHGIKPAWARAVSPASLPPAPAATLPAPRRPRCPSSPCRWARPGRLHGEKIAAIFQRIKLVETAFRSSARASRAGGRTALFVVLDAGREIVAANHAGMADRADAGFVSLKRE